jgi:hypothetical protein
MWRRVLVIGIFAVFILAIALMAYNARKTSPVRKVQEEIARLKREGEPTSWQEIAPPVPKHLDGTPLLLKAVKQLQAAQQKIPPNVWVTYNAQVLEAAQPALKTLRRAFAFPYWRLGNPKDFLTGRSQPTNPYLREFARLLRAEALERKRKGDVDGALESCQTILKLCRHMGNEPYVFAFLIQKAIFSIGVATLWERVLSDLDASAAAYRTVLAELRAWDIDRNFVQVLKGERVLANEMFEWLRSETQKLRNPLNVWQTLVSEDSVDLMFLLSPQDWFAENQLQTLEFYRLLIPVAQKGIPYDHQQVHRLIAEFKRKCRKGWKVTLGKWEISWGRYPLAEASVDIYDPLLDWVTETHALQRVTMTALALRLYRKENGRYPENLQQLAPKYLPSVPIDPYDGKPIRYRKLQKGFKVWSVGGNRKDDGGVKVHDWWRKGDLVLESKI